MKNNKTTSRRNVIIRNVLFMLLLGVLIVGGVAYTGEQVDAKAVKVDRPAKYVNYTDKQVTDTLFTELISSKAGILNAEAVFTVNNFFNESLIIQTDYIKKKGNIKTIQYFLRGNVSRVRYETTFNKTLKLTYPNGTKVYEDTPNGTKTINYKTEEWLPTDVIPAGYKNKMRAVGTYDDNAFKSQIKIDWIPKVLTVEGLKVKEYKQKKWAWWDVLWLRQYDILLNSSNNGTHFLEPVLLNLTEYGVSCPTETNFSSIRILVNDTTEVAWQFHSHNTSGEGWTIYADFNSTSQIDATYNYTIYCDSAASANGNTTIYGMYMTADGIQDNADFTRFWVGGAGNATALAVSADDAGLTGHGLVMNVSTTGNMAKHRTWDKVLNENFTITWHEMKPAPVIYSVVYLFQAAPFAQGTSYDSDLVAGNWKGYNGAGFSTYTSNEWITVKKVYDDTLDKFILMITNDSSEYVGKQVNPIGAGLTYGDFYIHHPPAATTMYDYYDDIFASTQNITLYKRQAEYSIGAVVIGGAAPPVVETLTIGNLTSNPASPTTWDVQQYVFNVSIVISSNRTNISDIRFELDGVNYTTITNTTEGWYRINSSYARTTGLDVGVHPYTWYANTTTGTNSSSSGNYTILQANNNNISITVTPSNSVDAGESVTINCSASAGTPTLEVDSINYAPPQTLTLLTGTHNATCFVSSANYSSVSNGTFITVGTLQASSAGCADNYTYAFQALLVVTNNTSTVINMTAFAGDGVYFRADLQDILIYNHSYWINNSELLIVNTTGEIDTVLTVLFGNAFINNELNTSWGADINVTDAFENVTIIGNYTTISFVDEITATTAIPPNMSSFYTDFTCTDGNRRHTFVANTTTTEYLFATNYTFQSAITTVQYGDGSSYTRAIRYQHPIELRFIWLVDAQTYTMAKVTNQLYDYVGTFSEAMMTIKKQIGNALRIIDERPFDATDIHIWYGIIGGSYQYHIEGDQETRALGNVIVDLYDLEKDVVISSVGIAEVERQGDIQYYSLYNNTTGILTIVYNDTIDRTNWASITVYNMTNGTRGLSIYNSNTTNSTAIFTYAVPDTAASYKVLLEFSHNTGFEYVPVWFTIGASGATVVGLGIWGMYIGLIILFSVGLSFSQKFAAFGMMIMFIISLMLFNMGFLSGYVAISVLTLGLVLSIIWFVKTAMSRGADEN